MTGTKNIDVNSFSPHLFWDVDASKIDLLKHKKWLVGRILEYGLLKDWKLLVETIGINDIAITAKDIRDLSPKTLFFISMLSGIPKENFRCYNTIQSQKSFWSS